MPMKIQMLSVLMLSVAMLSSQTTDLQADVPSYKAARDAYRSNRANTPGPKLTAEEKVTMARAASDLAAAMPQPGLQVGEAAPGFSLPDAFGRAVSLSELLQAGPVVLSFYRGAWCPYCNLQLRQLQLVLPHIQARGAQLVAVTPQQPDKSREQVKKDGYPFPILSDLDDQVIKAYRLYYEIPDDLNRVYRERLSLDLADYNGPGRYGLPVPGTFVIARDGTITAAYADVDYRKRMEPIDILAALDRLAGANPNR